MMPELGWANNNARSTSDIALEPNAEYLTEYAKLLEKQPEWLRALLGQLKVYFLWYNS